MAGIPVSERMGAAGCANLWAGTTGLELVGALNVKAGYLPNGTALELNGVLRRLGIIDLDQGGFTTSLADLGPSPLNNTLRLPGLSGNYMSTPDTGAVSITGDIDIRVKVALDDWKNGPNTNQILISKNDTKNSFSFYVENSTGLLIMLWSKDGTTTPSGTGSSVAPTVANGATLWVRATLDVDNGASKSEVKYYTSADGVTWTQLGTTVLTADLTYNAIYDSPDVLEIGSRTHGTARYVMGNFYYAEVRSGIDGPVVAKFDSTQVGVTGERTPSLATTTVRAEAIRLPGVAGNYISQPDSALNSVTGDIDVRCRMALDDWTPGTANTILSKYEITGNLRSYRMSISAAGRVQLIVSLDGTATISGTSSVSPVVTDGAALSLKATRVAATGTFQFFTSADGVTWVQLGSDVGGTAGTLFDNNVALAIGGFFVSGALTSELTSGLVYQAEVRSGIDGPVVASFNAGNVIATGAKTPATVDLWTINGAAWSWDTAITEPSSGALRLPGVAGNYVSTPDAADISITGDIDLRAKVALDDWTPATTQTLIAKRLAGGNQRSYRLYINTGGTIGLGLSADGIAEANTASSVAVGTVGVTDGSVKWVRATWADATDQANYYTSDDGIAWTLLGAANQALVSAGIFDSTALLEVGSYSGGTTELMSGYIYRAEVYNGIAGTLVAAFDAQNAPTTTNRLPTTVTGATGKVWTLNGALTEWVNQPAPTPWTVNGSAWWWGLSSSSRYANVIELDPQYVQFDGTAGNYASTPDSAALSITGDIDLRAKIAADDWTPNPQALLLGKYAFVANGRSYALRLEADGTLTFLYSTAAQAGSTGNTRASTLPVPFGDGVVGWVRATADVDNGSSGHDVKFYTSNDGVTWTQLGATITNAGVIDFYDSTQPVAVASDSAGNTNFKGKVFYAEIRNGIGGSVAGEFFPDQPRANAIRTPTTIQGTGTGAPLWTLNGSAWSWGSYQSPLISTPDSAALSITGDIDLRAKLTVGDWRPFPIQYLFHKRTTPNGYTLRLNYGVLQLVWGDGVGTKSVDSTTAVAYTQGQTGWVRATLDVDNGAAGYDVKFYTSSDGVTWTQLGTTVTNATATSIGDSTDALEVGSGFSGSGHLMGTIHYAEIRNGIAGTVVGQFQPNTIHLTGLDPSTNTATTPTTLPSPTGEVWSLSGSGWRWRVTG